MSTQIALLVSRLVADTSQFERKMLTANRIMGGVGKAGFFMGLGVAGAIGTVVHEAGNFQESMNVLQAVTGASRDKMNQMRKEAIALGNDLKLPNTSAQDAADTLTELAKGGLSVKNAMAAARGTIQLSTAAQISNTDAAKIQARALNAFGLAGTKAGHVADLLAGAANKSTAEISDLALGVQQAGAVWHTGGQNIAGLTTALGEMANAGISGSDAGTSLKTMMSRLNPQTKKAAEEYKTLGINVFTASGHYKDIRTIIGEFHGALKKLNPEQKQHALYTIFGSDAIRAANVVLDGGTKKYDSMHKAITKSGSAQRLAQAHTKGLNGAIQALISQVQTLAITLGTLFLPTATQWVRKLSDAAGWMAKHPALIKAILVVLGILSVTMVALTGIYKVYMLVTKLSEFYTTLFTKSTIGQTIVQKLAIFWTQAQASAMWLLNAAMDANPIGLVIVAIAGLIAVAIVLYKHWKPFRDIVNAVWDRLKGFASWVKQVFSQSITTDFHQIVGWLKAHWQDVLFGIIFGPFGLLIKKAADAFGLTAKLKSAFSGILGDLKDWGSRFINWLTNLPGQLWNAAKSVGSSIKNGIVAGVTGAAGALKGIMENAINSAISLWNGIQIPGWHHKFSLPFGGPSATVGWGAIDLPDMPLLHLAKGGIVDGPTLALLGDNPGGREAVVPLPRGGLGGGENLTVQITVQGSVVTNRDLERVVLDALTKYGKRNGRVRLTQATTA